MQKGILIIATGHHNYGRMAYNLALTIKAKSNDLPIALIFQESAVKHLTPAHLEIFNTLIKTDKKWNELKLTAYDYTPFEQTLLVDADLLWMKDNVELVFDQLKKRSFACVNEGYYDIDADNDLSNPNYAFGGPTAQELAKAYKLKTGKLWKIRSEFILFKKDEKAGKIFAKAWEIYNDPKVNSETFAGVYPDEFAFDVALNICKTDCHIDRWQPTYWPNLYRFHIPELHKINKTYYAFSFGGNTATKAAKNIYDLIMQAATRKLGLKYTFKLQSKKEFLTERKVF
ncbi:MAG: hypothetical protein IPJ81_00620 [Chitinophagaceae bacterium]|nr:hypothetical protein [Chitinophagaceae bacterium]